jgi:hypothetical protein
MVESVREGKGPRGSRDPQPRPTTSWPKRFGGGEGESFADRSHPQELARCFRDALATRFSASLPNASWVQFWSSQGASRPPLGETRRVAWVDLAVTDCVRDGSGASSLSWTVRNRRRGRPRPTRWTATLEGCTLNAFIGLYIWAMRASPSNVDVRSGSLSVGN